MHFNVFLELCPSPSCNFRPLLSPPQKKPSRISSHLPFPPLTEPCKHGILPLEGPVLNISHPCIILSVPSVCSLACDFNIMCQSCICVVVCHTASLLWGVEKYFYCDVYDNNWETWGLFLFSFWIIGWICIFWDIYSSGLSTRKKKARFCDNCLIFRDCQTPLRSNYTIF